MQSTWFARTSFFLECSIFTDVESQQLKALDSLQAFEESADWALLSLLCDDFHLHISVFIYFTYLVFIYFILFYLYIYVFTTDSCQGRRQRGAICARTPHLKSVPSHFTVGPRLLHTSDAIFWKCGPPSGFWPLFLVLAPPAGKSWRRAWLMFHITKGNRITQERKND